MLRTGSLTSTAWAKSRSFSLAEMKAGPKVEHNVTLECSGNPPAGGLIGNAKWAGTPLAPILKECGVQPEGIEVVFLRSRYRHGKDQGRRLRPEFRAQPARGGYS
jgi:DMSO/TMAO reductase YedYZ molybdopterin-dependent catalytic subunit